MNSTFGSTLQSLPMISQIADLWKNSPATRHWFNSYTGSYTVFLPTDTAFSNKDVAKELLHPNVRFVMNFLLLRFNLLYQLYKILLGYAWVPRCGVRYNTFLLKSNISCAHQWFKLLSAEVGQFLLYFIVHIQRVSLVKSSCVGLIAL